MPPASRIRADDTAAAVALRFGPFEYRPREAALFEHGKAVRLGSRAIRILDLLVRTPGEYVAREPLVAAAWPDSVVEESNLRVQINALRRALGRSHIGSAAGRGYVLLTPVEAIELPAPLPIATDAAPVAPTMADTIPRPLTSLIGREHDIEDLVARLARGRLVTVVGPGGIGKTRVATAALLRIADTRKTRGLFADLSSLQRGASVVGVVASALQVDDDPSLPLEDKVIAVLAAKPTLLVLDNCEHVIEVAGALVERLSRSVESLRVLATSREPLRCDGEHVFRLGGLGVPTSDVAASDGALRFSSVELLVERARAAHGSFVLDDAEVPSAVELCRRLDGIPLAIELAAAQLAVLSLGELAEAIGRQFGVLGGGRRTAPPRHQTLYATLDWSYETLDAEEARVFEALSVFRAGFSVLAARVVAGSLCVDVARALNALVAKSLVVAEPARGRARLRMLEVTRSYARAKLEGSPHVIAVSLAHSTYVGDELARLSSDHALTTYQRHEAYGALIDDVRAAVDWSFRENGDRKVGLRLILVSAPAWVKLSLTNDYVAVIEDAVARVSSASSADPRDLMALYAQLLTTTTLFTVVGPVARVEHLLEDAIPRARATAGIEAQIVALWALFGVRLIEGRYDDALAYASEIAALAEQTNDGSSRAVGHRVLALAHFRLGRLRAAVHTILKASAAGDEGQSVIERRSLVYKHAVAAAAAHAGIAWLAGQPRQAAAKAREATRLGVETEDVLALCYSLAQVLVPLAFWMGDLDLAEARAAQLIELSRSRALAFWTTWGRAYEAAAARLRGRPLAEDFLAHAGTFPPMLLHTLGTILDEFADASASATQHWASAELARRRGILALSRGNAREGYEAILSARRLARKQGARAWELRAATSLVEANECDEALADLRALIETFDEDETSLDVVRARSVASGASPLSRDMPDSSVRSIH